MAATRFVEASLQIKRQLLLHQKLGPKQPAVVAITAEGTVPFRGTCIHVSLLNLAKALITTPYHAGMFQKPGGSW